MKIKLPFLLDGAVGSNLIAAGMETGQEPADFILKNPDVMKNLTLSYINAGSNAVLTPTFGVNPHKFGDDCEKLNKELIKITKEAVFESGKNVLIASDISPCGLFMEPMGSASFDEMYDAFARQIRVFEGEGIDLLSFMTMYSLSEARIALLACRELSEKPVFASMTVNSQGKTMTGSDICASVYLLGSMGATAVGINCSTGPDDMLPHIQRAFEIAETPIYCKPNAGNDASNYLSPSVFAEKMRSLLSAGASIVGGCCGTDPRFIEEIGKILPDFDEKPYTDAIEKRKEYKKANSITSVATEKSLYDFSGEISLCPIMDADTFADEFYDFDPDEYNAAHVAVETEADAKTLLSTCTMSDIPICVSCGDKTVLFDLARTYCGTLIVHENCGLDEAEKALLTEKYGAITDLN